MDESIKEGTLPFGKYRTYYRIVNPEGKKTPLLFLHGGPGSTLNSFEALDPLAYEDDRPLVMYDQFGCGLSSSDDAHPELYCSKTWVEELKNLRKGLGLKEVHLLGHSWGGMLAIIYLTSYPHGGVKSVILSSTLSSASLWDKETHRLIGYLPKEDRKIIRECEKSGNYDSEEFRKAVGDYLKLTVYDPSKAYRRGIQPPKGKSGRVCYVTAWGPSEFRPLGNLKDYEYTSKLKKIDVPVLLLNGGNDESTPLQNKVMYDHIQSPKKWVIFANCRHKTYLEAPRKYMKTVKEFIDHED